MKTYDVRCPICGKLNRNLYLEETDGWMECDRCRSTAKIRPVNEEHIIVPVNTVKWLQPETAVI